MIAHAHVFCKPSFLDFVRAKRIREAALRCGTIPAAWLLKALLAIPAPGEGCHPALLGAAMACRRARLLPLQASKLVAVAIPPGSREVGASEISQAVAKAYSSSVAKPLARKLHTPRPASKAELDGAGLFSAIASKGLANGATEAGLEAALLARSPQPVPEEPVEQARALLDTLYLPDARLFIGRREDSGRTQIRAAAAWRELMGRQPSRLAEMPLICANPLSGAPALTADGRKLTLRGDACVASFLYAIAEFDCKSRLEQLAFWHGMLDRNEPVAAIVDSGNKSLHAWLSVNPADAAQWAADVEAGLFKRLLVPLGCDPACRNESRLTRMPGHMRDGSGRLQKLLYLAGRCI